MEKLKVTTLEKDDFEYITDHAEFERGVAAYNEKIRLEGYEMAKDELDSVIQLKDMDIKKAEQKIQNYQNYQLQAIKKLLERGSSLQDIASLFDMEMPVLQGFIEHIKSMK